MINKEKKKMLQVAIPIESYNKLDRYCKEHDMPKSLAIHMMISILIGEEVKYGL